MFELIEKASNSASAAIDVIDDITGMAQDITKVGRMTTTIARVEKTMECQSKIDELEFKYGQKFTQLKEITL